MEEHDGMSPSLREIADGCHYHRSTVDRYLLMLEMQGRVKRDAHRARSIRLVKPPDRSPDSARKTSYEERDKKTDKCLAQNRTYRLFLRSWW
ncbi:MAG: helix-turn-helix domain-containing protein [Anaerolineae bacterium]|nr:helix-turn-helix domain-containing protein [Anaerolineae bacterium]